MSSEKTEQPTPKKLRDAREKGQVALSKDASSTATLGAAFMVLFVGLPVMMKDLGTLISESFLAIPVRGRTAAELITTETVIVIARLSLMMVGVVAIIGAAAIYFQIGFLFAPASIKPDLNRLNPFDRIKQTFSIKNWIELLKNVLKITFLGFLIWLVIKAMLGPLIQASIMGPLSMLSVLEETFRVLAINIFLGYLVIAAFDVFFQRWQHTRSLMMTKDEVKQEYKESEGSPEIKSRRRQIHEEIVLSDDGDAVAQSDVMVTNPIHLAIAIRSTGPQTLPVVMAMGRGLKARHLRRLAEKKEVPTIENVELARDLYRHCRIGDPVPDRLVAVVFEVLKWAHDQKGIDSYGDAA